MFQKQSDLGHNLRYQQVVLFEIKLGEETLIFHTQISIMTIPPIFPSLCFILFSRVEENKLSLLPYNTIGVHSVMQVVT